MDFWPYFACRNVYISVVCLELRAVICEFQVSGWLVCDAVLSDECFVRGVRDLSRCSHLQFLSSQRRLGLLKP